MISFLVTTKNEGNYVNQLLQQLVTIISSEDEIVILDDYSDDELTLHILSEFSESYRNVNIFKHNLNKNFAEHKNFGKEKCSQFWIFQIDADELLSDYLANNIHTLLEYNQDIDLFLVPRINIVDGLTQDDVLKWNWRLNENGFVNFPDFQMRLFKNLSNIKWVNKVHERIEGFEKYAQLPAEENWSLIHHKHIERQRRQNEFYQTI